MKSVSRALKASNRSLLRELVSSDFKLRYQGSVLGYLWSLLRPLMLFGVLYIVFTKVFKFGKDIPYYPSYLLLGLVAWTFFIEATTSGMNSITGRSDLVRKVNIPKYIIVVSTAVSALINFCLNLIVVVIFMLIGHVPFRDTLILMPLLIVELIILCLGFSFLLSAMFVKFRDISHIWDVILQILFYATPIIYSLAIVPHRFASLLSLNPLAQIIQDMRWVAITPVTLTTTQVYDSIWLGLVWPIGLTIAIFLLGAWYFRRSSRKFAEEL